MASKIYWVKRGKDNKDLLIFSSEDIAGDIHIYEHKEDKPIEEIQKEMKKYYGSDKAIGVERSVHSWIEKNFGYPMTWEAK